MAKNRQPIAKHAKALGVSPAAMGYFKKKPPATATPMFAKEV